MHCSKCGFPLPERGRFCPHCGEERSDYAHREIPSSVQPAQSDWPVSVPESTPTAPTVPEYSPFTIGDAKRKSVPEHDIPVSPAPRRPHRIVIALLLVLVVVLAGLNVYQYFSSRKKLAAKDKFAGAQQEMLVSLNERIDDLQAKGSWFDHLCMELTTGNLGYATDYFYADEPIIVMRDTSEPRKITLTGSWDSGATVTIAASSDAAWVYFDEETWEDDDTTLSVVAQEPGICAVTFSNDVDDYSFKVIIVTD